MDSERIGELLSQMRPAPDAWVEAAARIPGTERDLADVHRRLEEDALLREAVRADPRRALEEAGITVSPELLARLREELEDS